MAEEYTRADLTQNAAIEALKRRVEALEARRAPTGADPRVDVLEDKVEALDPLRDLLEFVESIKAHFQHLRLR